MTHFVLVHGAWHSHWCWSAVEPILRSSGHQVTSLDLHRGTLSADTAAVQDVIDGAGRDTVVCGHSYGGAVITGLRPHLIRHALYLAAVMPEADESIVSIDVRGTGRMADWVEMTEGGESSVVPAESARDVFYHDCSRPIQDEALRHLRPQLTRHFVDPPRRVLWHDVASTYVICSDDRAMPPATQEAFSGRAGRTHTLPTSHSPFLSQPDRVAEILLDLAES
jgi:pimeloyl-ACP methyl ester carboxylesterase